MAITVSFNPNVTTYLKGDAPITVTMAGTPTTGYNDYLWESDNGTFSNKFSNAVIFTPNNGTKLTTVIARRTRNFLTGFVTPANFSTYGSNGGQRKSAGSSATWEAGNLDAGFAGADGFFEFEVAEITAEKAGGLILNSTYIDPNLTGSNSFTLNWHFSTNGTVVAKKEGTTLTSTPIFYKIGDIFRVEVKGTKSIFYMNGVKIVDTLTPSGNLFGAAGFKTVGAIINNPTTFTGAVTNQGIKTLQVYGVFPEQPNYSYEINQDNVTLVSFAEDRSAKYKVKSGIKRTLSPQFVQRPVSEYINIQEFWELHQKHLSFYYKDIDFDKTYLMVFDSGIRLQINGPDNVTISFVLREI